jgi:hypothetical protein
LRIRDLEKESANETSNHIEKELYILMELLNPIVNDNFIISSQTQMRAKKDGNDCLRKIRISDEFGIFGVLITDGSETVLNEASGYFLRSKPAENSEG